MNESWNLSELDHSGLDFSGNTGRFLFEAIRERYTFGNLPKRWQQERDATDRAGIMRQVECQWLSWDTKDEIAQWTR